MILDMDTPILNKLEINGILRLKYDVSVKLQAYWIHVRQGNLEQGDENGARTIPIDASITHEIMLHGQIDTFGFEFDSNWRVEAGNKALAVTG